MLNTLAMAEQLKGEYRKAFETADMYTTVEDTLTEGVRDEKMMDLYDILMEAQHEERPIETIIGNDIETFCKTFFPEKKNMLERFFTTVYRLMKGVLVFCLLEFFLPDDEGAGILTMQMNLLPILGGVFVGGILVLISKFLLLPLVFKSKKMNPTSQAFLILGMFIIGVIIALWITGGHELNLNNLALTIISGAYIVIYLIVMAIRGWKKYGKVFGIHKEEKKLMKEFNKEVSNKSDEMTLADMLAKRFVRINKKRRKKGKPELTQEDFVKKISKDDKAGDYIYIICWIVVVIGSVIYITLNNEYAEDVGTVVFAVVYCAMTYVFFRIGKTGAKQKKAIFDACAEKGITIAEYVKLGKEAEAQDGEAGEETVEAELRNGEAEV